MQYSQLDDEIKPLVEEAIKTKAHAYCPYSNFRVGSAVLTASGQIFAGCNVENACYGLSICAERVAIMNAVSQGHQSFKAIAVCCDIKGSFKGSCGACRQFYAEFGLDWDVYLVKPDRTWKKVQVKELLPLAFSPQSLKEERITDDFGLDWDVYLVKPDRTWKKVQVKELLPLEFSPQSLKEERITDDVN